MSPERALAIWDARLPFGTLSMTEGERRAVWRVWKRMPGHTCFADALSRIARGEEQEAAVLIGTAVFCNGPEIIEQTPVYWGESPDSEAVRQRAAHAIEVLGIPATDPVHGSNARLHKLRSATVTFYPRGA